MQKRWECFKIWALFSLRWQRKLATTLLLGSKTESMLLKPLCYIQTNSRYRGYLLFWDDTKNISSSVLKILMFSTPEMKYFWYIIEKKVNFLFILYVSLAMYCNWTADRRCGLEPIHYYHMMKGWRKQRNSSNTVEVLIIVNHEIWWTHQFKIY